MILVIVTLILPLIAGGWAFANTPPAIVAMVKAYRRNGRAYYAAFVTALTFGILASAWGIGTMISVILNG